MSKYTPDRLDAGTGRVSAYLSPTRDDDTIDSAGMFTTTLNKERHMSKKRLLMLALVRVIPPVLAFGMAGSAYAQQVCNNGTSTNNGYFYSFYRSSGTGCMTLGSAGNYSTSYSLGSTGNLVAGKGWATGTTSRVIGYNAGNFTPGNNSYLALYGWSTNPLVEYYVVDNWGGFTPPGTGASLMGQVNTDGGTYNIYRTQRVNQPSIVSNSSTFYQYWSVRTAKRSTGTNNVITFANHVSAWRTLGMNLGTMNYQILATEGYGSNGSSNITVWQQ